MENQKFDLAVVGAGVHGLSTCLYLAMKYPKMKFTEIENPCGEKVEVIKTDLDFLLNN